MAPINRPTKEQVRSWLANRRQTPAPLPSNEQIRRQLGWGMVAMSASGHVAAKAVSQ